MSRLEAWTRPADPAPAVAVVPDPLRGAAVERPYAPVAAERAQVGARDALLHGRPTGEDAPYVAAVAERLRSAAEDVRAAALDGPWSFKHWLVGADGNADGGEQPARNRLLHALFPGTYAPVAAECAHAGALDALLHGRPTGDDATYVAAVGERLRSAAEDVRAPALDDPWSFKRWLVGADGNADGGEQPARNRLLHALFPGTYEPIWAPEEKHAIADAFGSLALDADRDDVDHTLFAVRARLQQLAASGTISLPDGVDYHSEPLCETWDAGELGRGRSGMSHLDALRHKKQVVLHGPPGTGKTFEAKALADRLIRGEAMRRWGPVEYLQRRERVSELVRQQVRRRQLHQAYSYEDFVIGLRVAENGETEPYRGDLLQLIDEIRQARVTSMDPEPLPWVLILDEINRTDLSRLLGEAFSALDDRDAQIDLPAVGGHAVDPFKLPQDLYLIGTMNTIDQSVEQLDFALRRRFFWLHSGFRRHVIPAVLRARWEALDRGTRPWIARHPWDALDPDVAQLADHAAALNRTIAESPLLGPDYELGHTYFFDVVGFVADQPRLRSAATAPGHYLWDADGRPAPALVDLWSHSIEPLLADYLSGLDGGARDAHVRELASVFLAPAGTHARSPDAV